MAENVAAKPYKLLIGGGGIEEKETMKVIDKYSGETIGVPPMASKKPVEKAIAAAHAAFPSSSRLPAHKRFRILEKTSQLLAKHQDEIATIICREAGKAWKYSFGEVTRAVETFQFSAEEAKRVHGETIPMDASVAGEGRMGGYLGCPGGGGPAILPSNFPLNLHT